MPSRTSRSIFKANAEQTPFKICRQWSSVTKAEQQAWLQLEHGEEFLQPGFIDDDADDDGDDDDLDGVDDVVDGAFFCCS